VLGEVQRLGVDDVVADADEVLAWPIGLVGLRGHQRSQRAKHQQDQKKDAGAHVTE
jgi:hypothetical protein